MVLGGFFEVIRKRFSPHVWFHSLTHSLIRNSYIITGNRIVMIITINKFSITTLLVLIHLRQRKFRLINHDHKRL